MKSKQYFIFDFDSTLVDVESLELLVDISLRDHPQRTEVAKKVASITEQGVNGEISFRDSLKQRLQLLQAHREHLPTLVAQLHERISTSVRRNIEFFQEYSQQIYVVSGGFKEFIEPVLAPYHILPEHIYANTFVFDDNGYIVGCDEENPLAESDGKIVCLEQLDLSGEVFVIGDSYSDYVTKEAGLADQFVVFTENVLRHNILDHADYVAPTLDDFLYHYDLPRATSFPKSRIKVLLLESIHADAQKLLQQEGFTVETLPGSLSEEELCQKIAGVFILGIRSRTQLTAKVLAHADRLLAVGAFCIGTNQIDLERCAQQGVAVFNAPYSNTRSVVELAIGEIIMLMRQIFDRSSEVHQQVWNKSAKNCYEIRGKKLGIIGYGNIGQQLSVVAEAMGMEVFYYDIVEKQAMGNARKCYSLQELLGKVEVVTVHVDGRKENQNLIGESELRSMRPGAYFLNLSRGFVVDLDALQQAISSGHLAGAAIDVYPEEPKTKQASFVNPLQKLSNVILTPHIGGSTEEAQQNIAEFVPQRLIDYINSGDAFESVNFPNIRLPHQRNAHRLLHIHRNVPGVMAKINKVFAAYDLNVVGQYLKTNEHIGYLITDVDKRYQKEAISELRALKETVKLRMLY